MASQTGHIEVISKHLIKPSSPTPDHLRIHKLSMIDQIMPPVYIAIVFFYDADDVKRFTSSSNGHGGVGETLKDSLSITLTSFYPLAGQLDAEDVSIICDDTGVELVEARAHSRVADVLKDPKLGQVEQYLPVHPTAGVFAGDGTLFTAQINYLDCGGIAIGVCLAHFIGDGASLVQFMNSWAATSRGGKWATPLEFGPLGRWLPTRDLSDTNVSPDFFMGKGELMTKRFVFDKQHLAALKAAAGCGEDPAINPTRVEALSAFILQNFIENKLPEGKTRFAAMHLVNIRTRASKSFQLEHAFGNGAITTVGLTDQSDSVGRIPPLHELVSVLSKAIRKIDEEYIQKTHTQLHYLSEVAQFADHASQGVVEEVFLFSSWSRFPIYDVDFGWGRPEWVCTTALELNNLAIFMGAKDGEGIEAWINSPPEHLESLEKKVKLLGIGSEELKLELIS